MPTTPLHVYHEIAARYGVDPSSNNAVDYWFSHELEKLPAEEREAILQEMLDRKGEPAPTDAFKWWGDMMVKVAEERDQRNTSL